jgi:16S rRNA (guanine966-N2)-methyltransferase
MRLTGGLDRGRKLKAPRGLKTRPTGSKVREAVFNILGPAPDGDVLDLFAGTGALGIESLSRGAKRAVFVERDPRALSALRSNLTELGFADRSLVIGREVQSVLATLAADGRTFEWVFVDPPYAAGVTQGVLEELGNLRLAVSGVVIVEHDKRNLPPEAAGGLQMTNRRFYGDTGLSFYRHPKEGAK